jgi:hypothetical protein
MWNGKGKKTAIGDAVNEFGSSIMNYRRSAGKRATALRV